MIRKHKSSMGVFFGIYLAVTVFIGGAMLTLYLSNKKAQEKVAIEKRLALVEKEKVEAERLASLKKKQEEESKKKEIALAKAKEAEEKAKKAE